jgi:hypothetical protein
MELKLKSSCTCNKIEKGMECYCCKQLSNSVIYVDDFSNCGCKTCKEVGK